MSTGVCKSDGCNNTYNHSVSFTPPYCRECSGKRWKEKYTMVEFNKYWNRIGWHWSIDGIPKGHAFTKRGAIWQATRYVKKQRKATKKFTLSIGA